MTTERLGYALFTVLALLVGGWIRGREARRIGLPRDFRHAKTAMGGLIGAIVGAKLLMILYVPVDRWLQILAEMQRLDFDGKTVIGGLTGGYLGVEVAKRIEGITVSTGDSYAIALPVGHAIGRLGCLWNGCCYGAATDVPWAVVQHGAPRHPAQLYEALGNLALAGLLFAWRERTRAPGQLFRLYLVGYATLRFALDPLRGDAHLPLGPLTAVQLYCLAVIAVFGTWAWRDQRR